MYNIYDTLDHSEPQMLTEPECRMLTIYRLLREEQKNDLHNLMLKRLLNIKKAPPISGAKMSAGV